jgi:hypothetical protein
MTQSAAGAPVQAALRLDNLRHNPSKPRPGRPLPAPRRTRDSAGCPNSAEASPGCRRTRMPTAPLAGARCGRRGGRFHPSSGTTRSSGSRATDGPARASRPVRSLAARPPGPARAPGALAREARATQGAAVASVCHKKRIITLHKRVAAAAPRPRLSRGWRPGRGVAARRCPTSRPGRALLRARLAWRALRRPSQRLRRRRAAGAAASRAAAVARGRRARAARGARSSPPPPPPRPPCQRRKRCLRAGATRR